MLQVHDQTDRLAGYLGLGIAQALKEMQRGAKNDPTSLIPVGPYAHGPAGLFSRASQNDAVFSAMTVPLGGIGDQLPILDGATETGGTFGGDEAEFYTIITGVTKGASEEFANQPTAACADGARSGIMKVCTLVSPLGNYRFAPNAPVDVKRAGIRAERADPMTLRLVNSLNLNGPFLPVTVEASMGNVLLNEWAKRSFEMGMSMRRFFAQEVFVANPASNSGQAKRFTGLDLLINVNNKVDADTSNVCTAANSDIKNFGFDLVSGNGRDIVQYLEMMYTFLNFNSIRSGLGVWDGVIVMRPELFEEIVKVFPVRAYNEMLAQIAAYANGRVNIDGRQALDFRNELLTQQYLPLKGRRINVVLDDGIFEDDVTTHHELAMGQYASDIYFVPLRAGGVPVTYWKMFNFANDLQNTLVQMLNVSETFVTDGGFFAWDFNFKNGCLDWTTTVRPRLTMRTTWLAGRIQHVAYAPLQHVRSYDPDSGYFVDGGRTNTPEHPFYSEWSVSTPVNI